MKHKGFMREEERMARSELVKILSWEPFVQGGLVKMKRVCGKPNCRCAKEGGHVSLYLACKYKNKRKMICIPKQKEKEIEGGVNNYKKCMKLMGKISNASFERIMRTETKKMERGQKF